MDVGRKIAIEACFGHKAESQRLVMGDPTLAFLSCESPLSSLLKAIMRPRSYSRGHERHETLSHGQLGSHWSALWLFTTENTDFTGLPSCSDSCDAHVATLQHSGIRVIRG
jgi:hypothetical protein